MKINPYTILGVEKTASDEEIKAAYRKKASSAHPDKDGGSTEEFQKISAAYTVLGDPEKRKRLDEGQSVKSEYDDIRGRALQEIAGMMFQAIQNPDFDPADSDLVEMVREAIKEGIRQREVEIADVVKQVAKRQNVVSRILIKKGKKRKGMENLLAHMIESDTKKMEGKKLQMEGNKALGEIMLEVLSDYKYDWIDPFASPPAATGTHYVVYHV